MIMIMIVVVVMMLMVIVVVARVKARVAAVGAIIWNGILKALYIGGQLWIIVLRELVRTVRTACQRKSEKKKASAHQASHLSPRH
jgi:hypothetical protein